MIKHKISPEHGFKVAKIVKVKDNTIIFEIQNDGSVPAEANYGLQLILHFLFSQQKPTLEYSNFIDDDYGLNNNQIEFIHYLQHLRTGYELISSKEAYETAIQLKDVNDNAGYEKRYLNFHSGPGPEFFYEHVWYIKEIPPFYKLFTEWSEKCISKLSILNETFSMRGNYKFYTYQFQLEADKGFRFLVQHLKRSDWEEVKCYDFKNYFY